MSAILNIVLILIIILVLGIGNFIISRDTNKVVILAVEKTILHLTLLFQHHADSKGGGTLGDGKGGGGGGAGDRPRTPHFSAGSTRIKELLASMAVGVSEEQAVGGSGNYYGC